MEEHETPEALSTVVAVVGRAVERGDMSPIEARRRIQAADDRVTDDAADMLIDKWRVACVVDRGGVLRRRRRSRWLIGSGALVGFGGSVAVTSYIHFQPVMGIAGVVCVSVGLIILVLLISR